MLQRSPNAILATGVSLLPLPALKLLDALSSGCGDGLCGFLPGLIILGTLAAATLALLLRSARQKETPIALRVVPLILWVLALVPLIY